MVGLVGVGFSFERTEFAALDASYVFDTVADLETYLSGSSYVNPPYQGVGNPYNGQILAVLNGTAQPDIYTVWEVPSGTAGAVAHEFNGLFYAYAPSAAAAEGVTVGSTTAPPSPVPGDMWTTPSAQVRVWHSSGAWVQVFP